MSSIGTPYTTYMHITTTTIIAYYHLIILNPFITADKSLLGLICYLLQTNTDTFANSADPDETVSNEPSHQDLHCLPFCLWFLTKTPIVKNGLDQIRRWKSPFNKLKGLNKLLLIMEHAVNSEYVVYLGKKESYLIMSQR